MYGLAGTKISGSIVKSGCPYLQEPGIGIPRSLSKGEAVQLVRGYVHPVSQVGRDMGTPDNVLYHWISRHRQAEDHETTRAYELYRERGCREDCILKISWGQNGTC